MWRFVVVVAVVCPEVDATVVGEVHELLTQTFSEGGRGVREGKQTPFCNDIALQNRL